MDQVAPPLIISTITPCIQLQAMSLLRRHCLPLHSWDLLSAPAKKAASVHERPWYRVCMHPNHSDGHAVSALTSLSHRSDLTSLSHADQHICIGWRPLVILKVHLTNKWASSSGRQQPLICIEPSRVGMGNTCRCKMSGLAVRLSGLPGSYACINAQVELIDLIMLGQITSCTATGEICNTRMGTIWCMHVCYGWV